MGFFIFYYYSRYTRSIKSLYNVNIKSDTKNSLVTSDLELRKFSKKIKERSVHEFFTYTNAEW